MTPFSKYEKLLIKAYESTSSTAEKGEYRVLFNPEQLSESLKIEWNEDQAGGTSGTNQTFNKITPPELALGLLFDGTGATGQKDVEPVEEQIRQFKEVVFDYDGDYHEPPYIGVFWGNFKFFGRLEEVAFTYDLFKPDGSVLRAKADVRITRSLADELRIRQQNDSSPDLTHVKSVHHSDTLPLMCYKTYNHSDYYVQVAQVNKLYSFRDLTQVDELIFPPLDKQS